MRNLLLMAGSVLVMAACAAPDTVSSTESPSEREYPTGSNLPRKKAQPADAGIPMGAGVRAHSREDLERMQNSGAPSNPDSPRGR